MCRAKCSVVVGTSRPLPGYWITPVLRVLRTLCHPLQQSRFMSGGAKRSSLNQRFHEIKIDSFLDIWIDGWIYLSIQISFAISPKSLIWPGNKALLWAQEAKGMSSAASPPHFFISPCPFRMRFARHWRFALLLFLHWRVRMDFAVLSQRKWKGLYHIEMSIRFPPQMRWGISHLCPFIFMKGIEARPGSRRSNNRRGAPQYTIARSNWESYYT
jgi:hypothetical protein